MVVDSDRSSVKTVSGSLFGGSFTAFAADLILVETQNIAHVHCNPFFDDSYSGIFVTRRNGIDVSFYNKKILQ